MQNINAEQYSIQIQNIANPCLRCTPETNTNVEYSMYGRIYPYLWTNMQRPTQMQRRAKAYLWIYMQTDIKIFRIQSIFKNADAHQIPMQIRIQMLIPIQMQNIPNPHLRIQTQKPIQILSIAAEHSPLLGSMGRQLISGDEPLPPASDHNNICWRKCIASYRYRKVSVLNPKYINWFFTDFSSKTSNNIWVICYCWGKSSMVEGRFWKWF